MSYSSGPQAVTRDDVIREEKVRLRACHGVGAEKILECIGLALSGGGVRAAAVSLGFLMGLHERQLLNLMDYLSTVSGGGYAGGLLTAERVAEAKGIGSVCRLFAGAVGADRGGNKVEGMSRLRGLVAHCNYLIRNQSWMSRALLGVAAMGTLSISTMIFLTAFLAWLFRLLYLPQVLEFLKVLGFEGDLIVPLTPAFGMFLLWLCCWLLSFIRHYRQATGRTAGYVFRGFLFCAVLGVTMIAVTGDVDAEQFLRHTGISVDLWQQVAGVGGWLKSGMLALIGASLIPFFRPSALLRSGRERVAGPKKLLFVLARTGMLLGIPLISFGMLAREDISAWNRDRDFRLEFKDLIAVSESESVDTMPQLRLFLEFQRAIGSANSDPKGIELLRREVAKLMFQDAIEREWGYYCRCQREYELLNAGATTASESAQLARLNPANERTRIERLAMLFSHVLLWEQSGEEASDFGQMRYWLQQSRESQRRLMFLLNTQLLNPDLFKMLGAALNTTSGLPGESSMSKSGSLIDEQSTSNSEDGRSKQSMASHDGSAALRALLSTYQQLWREHAGTGDYENSQMAISLKRQIQKSTELVAQSDSAELRRICELPASMQSLFESMWQQGAGSEGENLKMEQFLSSLLKCNHQLLALVFPGAIRQRGPSSEIFSSVVHTRDQEVRWSIMVRMFWIALVLSIVVDLNSLSWHGFYSRQLGMFWVRAGYEQHEDLLLKVLSESGPANCLRPLHLLNAAVCFTGRSTQEDGGDGENPDHFLLSPLYCGSAHSGIGFVRTAKSPYGSLRFSDAIALSGAALSPWATSNPLVRVLLLVMNLRTGLWMPNPGRLSEGSSFGVLDVLDRHLFCPLRWLALRFVPAGLLPLRPRRPEDWSHLLVTDGGHYENLGIESLLQRKCRLMIAVDASEDANYEFQGLAIVLNRARTRDGIRFFDAQTNQPFRFPDKVVPDEQSQLSRERFFAIRVEYPEAAGGESGEGLLLVVKSALLSTDPFELQQHRKEFPAFPNDPTADQFFSPEKFEAYRHLGFTAACQLVDRLKLPGSPNGADLIAAVRRQFFDGGRVVSDLESALKYYRQGRDFGGLAGAGQEDRSRVLQGLQLWTDLSAAPAEAPGKVLFNTQQFREDLLQLLKDVEFEKQRPGIERLLEWLGPSSGSDAGTPRRPGAGPGKRGKQDAIYSKNAGE